jgi:AcrR family transcriptional regulator
MAIQPTDRRIGTRRKPVQRRAQLTIDAIFQATARVLIEDGQSAISTNRIAERAGVSIGTLYQYYSSKEEILAALIDHEREQSLHKLESLLTSASTNGTEPEDTIRQFVEFCVRAFAGDAPERIIVARVAWQWDSDERVQKALSLGAERVGLRLQTWANANNFAAIPPERIYVAMRSLMGAIRFASLERSPMLESPVFARELAHMCAAVLLRPV